jgi:hypothetical protein
MTDVQGEVRVRSVRSVRSDSFVETAMEFGGGVVRLGFSLFTLPLALLPSDTRHHMQNATKELMYAFASLPRDFADIAGQSIEEWAKESDVAPTTSSAPRDEVSAS